MAAEQASMHEATWRDTWKEFKWALGDRKPITLANGIRTIDYQVWRISFGTRQPGMFAVQPYVVDTNPIILRELREDRCGTALYSKLKEVSPERLFPAEYYYLQYQLPGAPFTIRVRIDNRDEVVRCYKELGRLSHRRRLALGDRGALCLVPRVEGAPCFDFEPEDLVTQGEMRSHQSLTAFLGDLYMAGRISALEFDHVMHQNGGEMRKETFKLIPAREQPRHEYLNSPPKPKKELPPEDKYHLGLVTLGEFRDLKRPDLARQKAKLSKRWPIEERTFLCVVCGEDRGTIKCMECENRCCAQCVRLQFSEYVNPEAGPGGGLVDPMDGAAGGGPGGEAAEDPQTFLLLHHIYCQRNGRILHVQKATAVTKRPGRRKLKPM